MQLHSEFKLNSVISFSFWGLRPQTPWALPLDPAGGLPSPGPLRVCPPILTTDWRPCTVLLYRPLLCGFNVPVKGLTLSRLCISDCVQVRLKRAYNEVPKSMNVNCKVKIVEVVQDKAVLVCLIIRKIDLTKRTGQWRGWSSRRQSASSTRPRRRRGGRPTDRSSYTSHCPTTMVSDSQLQRGWFLEARIGRRRRGRTSLWRRTPSRRRSSCSARRAHVISTSTNGSECLRSLNTSM